MAKFTGKNQTLTFNAVSTWCITGIDYTDTADNFTTACAGGTFKGTVTGLRDISATVQLLLDTNDVSELAAFEPGDNATDWSHDPNGAVSGDIRITSNSDTVTVTDRSIGVPVDGLVTASFTVKFNDFLIAAQ